ncbi:MAG: hypothetical protein HGA45_41925 [Chloroflexales bacterium]|nr:hypothetical protein [Chloroflexales bacterium]
MTKQASFSADDWGLLQNVLVGAGTAAMNAQAGGEQREMSALFSALSRAPGQFAGNELLADLLSGVTSDPRVVDDEIRNSAQTPFADQKTTVIDQARQAITILTQKATPEEVEGFRSLVYQIAETVVNAAGEGGSMGFSGEKVSAEEQSLLNDLKSALAGSEQTSAEGEAGHTRAVSE